MAQINIAVRDDLIAEILDAFDALYTRQQGDSKAAHAKNMVKAYVKGVLMEYRRNIAVSAAVSGVEDPGNIE
jgi:hypothetical protein